MPGSGTGDCHSNTPPSFPASESLNQVQDLICFNFTQNSATFKLTSSGLHDVTYIISYILSHLVVPSSSAMVDILRLHKPTPNSCATIILVKSIQSLFLCSFLKTG